VKTMVNVGDIPTTLTPIANARVGFLTLNANGLLGTSGCCINVVVMSGNNDLLDDTNVTGAADPAADNEEGVLVSCSSVGVCPTGVSLLRDSVYYDRIGVVFSDGASSSNPNVMNSTTVLLTGCDGVDILGYAVIENSTIYDNGGGCSSGFPAADIYTSGDPYGGLIENDNISLACGTDVDLLNASSVTITNNDTSGVSGILYPGYGTPAYGTHYPNGVCQGSALSLVNSSNNTVSNNYIENTINSSANSVEEGAYDPSTNHIYEANGAAAYADLPAGGDTQIGLVVAYSYNIDSHSTPSYANSNSITGNTIQGYCNSPCFGLGYFFSRDTGQTYTMSGSTPVFSWSASSTNYITNNNDNGSNVGSQRCGVNWYNGNNDDSQHTNTFYNDNPLCGSY
jgi:hypothetical protein